MMKNKLTKVALAAASFALFSLSGLAHADRLEDIKSAGVLRVASFDSKLSIIFYYYFVPFEHIFKIIRR